MSILQKNWADILKHTENTQSLNIEHRISALKKNTSPVAVSFLILLGDLSILYTSLYLGYITRLLFLPLLYSFTNSVGFNVALNLWWLPFLCIIVMAYGGLYNRWFPYWHEVKFIIKAETLSLAIAVMFIFLAKNADVVSRPVIVLTYLYSLVLLPCGRYFIKKWVINAGLWARNVLIVGSGKSAQLLMKGLCREFIMGYQPIGILNDVDDSAGFKYGRLLIPKLGALQDIEKVILETGIKDVIIAAPDMNNGHLVSLTNRLHKLSVNVILVPDFYGIPLSGMRVDYLFDEKTMLLSMRNNLASVWNRLLKQSFDMLAGTLILIAVLPIMLVVAIAIKIDSTGPAIFSHTRIGKSAKEFRCLKFRTMIINSQEVLEKLLARDPEIRREWELDFKLKNDPRITKVGKFLRKTSLDELPQIFNVLAGQMSLVGPRPIVAKEIDRYGAYFSDYRIVPPGITGLWQISGRNDVDYEERVQLDSWYTRNWSLWLDITILIRTVAVVLARKGAY